MKAYSPALMIWKDKDSGAEIKVLISLRIQTNYKSVSGSRYEP